MNTLLTAPVLSPATTGTKPITGSDAMARRPPAVQPRARILYADDEPQLRRLVEQVLLAVNNLRQCSGTRTFVLAHNARSVQSYLHGGINE